MQVAFFVDRDNPLRMLVVAAAVRREGDCHGIEAARGARGTTPIRVASERSDLQDLIPLPVTTAWGDPRDLLSQRRREPHARSQSSFDRNEGESARQQQAQFTDRVEKATRSAHPRTR